MIFEKQCKKCLSAFESIGPNRHFCNNCQLQVHPCENCWTVLTVKRFCSRACAAKWNSLHSAMKSTLMHGWSGNKICKDCGLEFIAASGNRRFCDSCQAKREICPECGGKKSSYHRFCGNSCAGKWKYRNSANVVDALVAGAMTPGRLDAVRAGVEKHLKGKARPNFRGEKNPNWSGGTYGTERHRLMGRIEYIEWRRKVFERDDYTCQICGKRGVRLNADHVEPYFLRPDLALAVSNGRTLCEGCHKETPTYGSKVKKLIGSGSDSAPAHRRAT